MTRREFYDKWDNIVLHSHSCYNLSDLLHNAEEIISDWSQIGGEVLGKDCLHLKLLLYRITSLVFDRKYRMARMVRRMQRDPCSIKVDDETNVQAS